MFAPLTEKQSMDTNISKKRLPRREVKKGVRRVWLAMREVFGSEEMYARLLIEANVSTSTARNAIEAGSATEEVEKKITDWCNANKKTDGPEELPINLRP
jgi:hypothetical protein